MTPEERDRIRRILTDSLPDDPKWAAWAEGVLDRLDEVDIAVLSPDERVLIIDVLRDIPDMDLRMAEIRPSRQLEIDERRALADRLERS